MIRCGCCGEPLVSIDAICETCLPGSRGRPNHYSRRMADVAPLRVLADDLGLVRDDIDVIRAEIQKIVADRNRYEEIETRHCGDVDLESYLARLEQAELAAADAMQRDIDAFRAARADVVSWAPTLRFLRDSMGGAAKNIDMILEAVEFNPVDCPMCGQPLAGSTPLCAGCLTAKALKEP